MIVESRLPIHVAKDTHPKEDDFSLVLFCLRRRKVSTCAETGSVEAGLPYLMLKVLHDAFGASKAAAARCEEKFAQVRGATVNTAVVLNLPNDSFVMFGRRS